ncbi:MAG: NTP transferase domain-containing protein [bacterium]|nr:MAG: NTP transferase domain-containing protein [bacterium]
MKAVVMAGGYGTRLRPLTVKLPKPMIPIANRPMLEHIIRLLKGHGFEDIIMLTYFFPEMIEDYFGDGSAFGVRVVYRQDPPGGLGTAGAVKGVQDLLDDTFLVISGDVITDFDLSEAVRFHRDREDPATMVLTRVDNPLPFGVVITDEENRVSRFLEKPSWGEVFSDSINTGIYIIEPEVLDMIPQGEQRDFSKDIFPMLLAEGRPPSAYLAEGYWRDIGNTVEYLQVHREIATGGLYLDIPGRPMEIKGAAVYLGEGASVDPEANLSGMIVLAEGSRVEGGCRIRDSFIGPDCRLGSRVRISSTVLWDGVDVEPGVFIAGSVIGSRTKVKTRANIEEGTIISGGCVIGRGSIIRAGVRIWPDKVVEDEAVLSTHFVWGTRWRGTLFTSGLVRGLSNKEITPEFASRLGAAFGATLPDRSAVSVSRGIHRAARMISDALNAGVLSVGIDVHDYGVVPIPLSRHQMTGQGETGGLHVRRSPSDPEVMEVRMFREGGRELATNERNEVDRLFFRMDFKRAGVEGAGTISYPHFGTEFYEKSYLKGINREALSKRRMRVVVDYSHGSTLKVLPGLLGRIGVEVISLNAHLDEERATRTTKEFDRAVRQISDIVRRLRTNLGAIVSASGETLFLIDDTGRWIDGGKVLQIISLLSFQTNPGAKVAVPVSASGNLEKIAGDYGGQIIRTPILPPSILDSASANGAFMAGSGEGGIAFLGFHPSFDAMYGLGKIIEMLAVTGRSLSDLVDSLPEAYLQRSIVPCPWEMKGQVMRRLVEELGEEVKDNEGVRFVEDGGWILIYPSSNHACFNIFAESSKRDLTRNLVKKWSRKVEEMQD